MGYRILIVDDEIGILQLLKDYFEIQGYEVLTAKKRTGSHRKSYGGFGFDFA